MNDDRQEELTLDQWIEFLEPQLEPERGAAICMSSADFSKIKSAVEQACDKLGTKCTKEQREDVKQVSARVERVQEKARDKKRKKKLQVPHVP